MRYEVQLNGVIYCLSAPAERRGIGLVYYLPPIILHILSVSVMCDILERMRYMYIFLYLLYYFS